MNIAKIQIKSDYTGILNNEINKINYTFGNIKKWIASPYGPTIFPMFLLIVAFLFPPDLYKHLVKEPNYTFLNFKMLLYAFLCLFFYYMGCYIGNFKPLFRITLVKRETVRVNYSTYLGLILFFTIILQILYLIFFDLYFIRSTGFRIIMVALSGKGQLVKDAFSSELKIPFGLGAIPSFLLPFEFWLLYQLYRLNVVRKSVKESSFKYLKFFTYISIALYISESLLTVNRPTLIMLLLGWFLIFLYFNEINILRIMLRLFVIIIFIFFITSYLRWSSGTENFTDLFFEMLLGYTVADYNRMALMIDGALNYTANGIPKLFYILPILKIPLTNVVFFDLTTYSSISLNAVGNAGLNSSFNMATLFGGIYQAIGLFSLPYFTFLGILGSRLFISFKRGKTFGIIMYPLFYSSVALWIIDVNFFLMNFLYFLYAFLVLAIYDFVWDSARVSNRLKVEFPLI